MAIHTSKQAWLRGAEERDGSLPLLAVDTSPASALLHEPLLAAGGLVAEVLLKGAWPDTTGR
jgi:hypothetical protein